MEHIALAEELNSLQELMTEESKHPAGIFGLLSKFGKMMATSIPLNSEAVGKLKPYLEGKDIISIGKVMYQVFNVGSFQTKRPGLMLLW